MSRNADVQAPIPNASDTIATTEVSFRFFNWRNPNVTSARSDSNQPTSRPDMPGLPSKSRLMLSVRQTKVQRSATPDFGLPEKFVLGSSGLACAPTANKIYAPQGLSDLIFPQESDDGLTIANEGRPHRSTPIVDRHITLGPRRRCEHVDNRHGAPVVREIDARPLSFSTC